MNKKKQQSECKHNMAFRVGVTQKWFVKWCHRCDKPYFDSIIVDEKIGGGIYSQTYR